MGRVVLWFVEPDPFAFWREVMDVAATKGVCSTCAWAHFTPPNPMLRFFPAMYDPTDFRAYRTAPEQRSRLVYMHQQRSRFSSHVSRMMRSINYTAVTEGWNETGYVEPYGGILRRFGTCRWLISLDTKPSAGQMVAEASMLGVPTIAYGGFRSNADLLLPSELLINPHKGVGETVARVRHIVSWYDANPRAYRRLSEAILEHAQHQLHPHSRAELAATLTSCCEDARARATIDRFRDRRRPRSPRFVG